MANVKNGEVAAPFLGEDATIRITLGDMVSIQGDLNAIFERDKATDGRVLPFHLWLSLKLMQLDTMILAQVAKRAFAKTSFKWQESTVPAADIAGALANAVNLCMTGKTWNDLAVEQEAVGDDTPPQKSPAT
jgi:hypothetical protein